MKKKVLSFPVLGCHVSFFSGYFCSSLSLEIHILLYSIYCGLVRTQVSQSNIDTNMEEDNLLLTILQQFFLLTSRNCLAGR